MGLILDIVLDPGEELELRHAPAIWGRTHPIKINDAKYGESKTSQFPNGVFDRDQDLCRQPGRIIFCTYNLRTCYLHSIASQT